MKNSFDFLAENLGIIYDKEIGAVYGNVNGIQIAVLAPMGIAIAQRTIIMTVSKNGQSLAAQDRESLKNMFQPVQEVQVGGNNVVLVVPNVAKGKIKTAKGEALMQAELIRQTTAYIAGLGYVNVCDKCGTTDHVSLCQVGNELSQLCQEHFEEAKSAIGQSIDASNAEQGNMVAGLFGAFLGCLVGAAIIAIIGALGFYTSIGGIVLGIFAFKGYDMAGKKISKLGVVLTIVMMVIVVYLAQMVSYALYLSVVLETSFMTILTVLHELIFSDSEIISAYYLELALLYLFTTIGAISPIRASLRKASFRLDCRQLSAAHSGPAVVVAEEPVDDTFDF